MMKLTPPYCMRCGSNTEWMRSVKNYIELICSCGDDTNRVSATYEKALPFLKQKPFVWNLRIVDIKRRNEIDTSPMYWRLRWYRKDKIHTQTFYISDDSDRFTGGKWVRVKAYDLVKNRFDELAKGKRPPDKIEELILDRQYNILEICQRYPEDERLFAVPINVISIYDKLKG